MFVFQKRVLFFKTDFTCLGLTELACMHASKCSKTEKQKKLTWNYFHFFSFSLSNHNRWWKKSDRSIYLSSRRSSLTERYCTDGVGERSGVVRTGKRGDKIDYGLLEYNFYIPTFFIFSQMAHSFYIRIKQVLNSGPKSHGFFLRILLVSQNS